MVGEEVDGSSLQSRVGRTGLCLPDGFRSSSIDDLRMPQMVMLGRPSGSGPCRIISQGIEVSEERGRAGTRREMYQIEISKGHG